jgi:serine/threonine protein kinase
VSTISLLTARASISSLEVERRVCDPEHKVNTEPAPGTRFAGYRIEALIGRGAMAEVYRARDDAGQPVALKLLDAASAQDERFRRRFLRESELAASLHDRHIVPTLDAADDEGRLYLAMEYVDGSDLRALLREEGRLGARCACETDDDEQRNQLRHRGSFCASES